MTGTQFERFGEGRGFGLSAPTLKFMERTKFHGHVALSGTEKRQVREGLQVSRGYEVGTARIKAGNDLILRSS